MQTQFTLAAVSIQICLMTFLFLHAIGKRRYDAILHHFLENEIQDRIHGNSKKLPHDGFTTPELKCIVSFLKNYAEENAILLPGRIPGFKRYDLQLLPTNTTKRSAWKLSCASLIYRIAALLPFVPSGGDTCLILSSVHLRQTSAGHVSKIRLPLQLAINLIQRNHGYNLKIT